MSTEPIDLRQALSAVEETWRPRIAAKFNNYGVRVAKVAGSSGWHAHDETDEFFLVLDGELRIGLRDPDERVVTLLAGSVSVVPRGVEHRPFAPGGASIVVIDPAGAPTAGDRDHERPVRSRAGLGPESLPAARRGPAAGRRSWLRKAMSNRYPIFYYFED